jgi:hypothetical protein
MEDRAATTTVLENSNRGAGMTPRQRLATFLHDLRTLPGQEDIFFVGHNHCLDEGAGDSVVDGVTLTVTPVGGGLEVAYGIKLVPVERNGQLAIEIRPFGSHPDPELRHVLR